MMDEHIWKFTGWIYTNYGRAGCAVALLIILSVLTLAYVLLNRLPEAKTDINK